MHFPSAVKDKLIDFASSKVWPSLPDQNENKCEEIVKQPNR